MNRKDMQAILQGGGSVAYRGRIIVHETDLPTAAELASGDPVAEQQATSDLQRQIAELQQQLATLQPSTTTDQADGGEQAADDEQADDGEKPRGRGK